VSTNLLEIENLQVNLRQNNKQIINRLNLAIKPGEVHAIMGPNGSGKSTLANTLTCHQDYEVTAGKINFLDKNLLDMQPHECARAGLFLSFQYPVAIPGVSNIQFLKTAVNSVRKAQNMPLYDSFDFLNIVKKTMLDLDMTEDFLARAINEGFSGGEKKRNEILQMILLQPKLAILDETDSGLDIDSLKCVANGINSQRNSTRSFLLITHYQRLLDYIKPDFIHVMFNGQIIKSGDHTLAAVLEKQGYGWLQEAANPHD
jgi:Fe-S cluster assembly ATP-binding protein